ncbi:PEP-CTERM sorting domain-containing protein [Exilibacterium tricleocarpae]|uniref:PEP-CTERM sorting domain-containing protein n=1 Tax=Exilibacterium tricleocarpae TaxID=2591008 RepID=A0A545ST59_9GAMM|nr:PEP-CTERM sorting domain-containing protein [Exilibacterium tricleocarpae]TQV68146.1 PEP-CTERM sorting domain-containing protein [Exilibacterium tricleocarpae]
MTMITRVLAALAFAAATSVANAIPTFSGDVGSGGNFSDTVDSADGWVTDNAVDNGVDFWTLNITAPALLTIDISSIIDFGISIYQGIVQDDLGFAFDNDADFTDPSTFNQGTFVAGTPSFGAAGSSLRIFLANAGDYTIAVGGDDFGFGGPYDYKMQVEVPEPGALFLLLSGVLALVLKRRMGSARH